jgi:hypothetical protein
MNSTYTDTTITSTIIITSTTTTTTTNRLFSVKPFPTIWELLWRKYFCLQSKILYRIGTVRPKE